MPRKKNEDGAQPEAELPPIPRKAMSLEPPKDGTRAPIRIRAEDLAAFASPEPRADQLAAKRVAEELVRRANERKRRIVEEEDAGKLFFLACRFCDSPAILFRRNPKRGKVEHGDWFSSAKALGQPWQGGKVRCMGCNAQAPLRYTRDFSQIIPIVRFLRHTDLDAGMRKVLESGHEAHQEATT